MRFLNTKFHIPNSGNPDGLIKRPHLLVTLDKAIDKRVALVHAPAGFGKTTLLSQWIFENRMEDQVCWVSIDQSDNSPVRFWSYILESFNRTVPGLCSPSLLQLEASRGTGIEETLISMINAITSVSRQFILVLDDFHLIGRKQILDQFSFFLDHPVENLLIVISTREKPGLVFSRLQISDALLEISTSHLKFTQPEMNAFMALYSPSPVPKEQEKNLYEATEGWVAAIKLAILSWKGGRLSALPGDGHQLIHDYLMEEVLSSLEDSLKSFIIRISIVDRFCPSLCRYITDDPDTESRFGEIARHRLFLIPLDDKGNWYRFHHMFLHFLRSVLQTKLRTRSGRLHTRAYEWFRQENFFDEAFYHALEAGREDLAGELLADNVSTIFGQGGEEAILDFFNQLSEHSILSHPVLAGYYLGFHAFSGDFTITEKMKYMYENSFSDEDAIIFKGFYLTVEAYECFYVTGDLDRALTLSREAITYLPRSHESIIRMLEYMQTICYRYSGRIRPAMALCIPRKTDSLLMAGMAAANRADLDLEMGHLNGALQVLGERIEILESIFSTSTPPALFGFVYILMGKALKEANRRKEAQANFTKGLSTIKNSDMVELIVISYGEFAQFLTCCGELKLANKTVDRAISYARHNFSWVENLLLAQKNRILMKEKKLAQVAPWADKYPVSEHMDIPFIQSLEYLTLARYFLETGAWQKTLHILNAMIPKDLEDDRRGRLMECYVLKAKALYLSGNTGAAAVQLTKAFDLSRTHGHVMVFLEDLSGMEPLFIRCRDEQLLPDHLVPHLDFMNSAGKIKKGKKVVINDFCEVLNSREIDILKLFKKGLSNRETADQLCLSVNTVRWYASRLFAKLDVKRRGQAVSKAESLQLI